MPFIILDRDGVINYDSDFYIKSPAEWIPIPGSLEAIARLNRYGYQVLIATNQSGIARGYYDFETLDLIHEKLMRELAAVGGYIQEIFICPHHPDQQCMCRKPKPGLLQQMQEKYPVHFSEMYFIGDSMRDVEAARAMGCKPLLVLTGKYQAHNPSDVPTFNDLAAAVDFVLGTSS